MSTIGPIALLGSGETAPGVQKIHRTILSRLDKPVRSVILETPAGFEPNSEDVAAKIAAYLERRMPEFEPEIRLIPARKRDSAHSPDDPDISAPIFDANHIFMGPGSPTYAARQLKDTYAWHAMQAGHRRGAAICFSSASTVSISRFAIPVYEIYKVGEELHWKEGLDFFGAFGLSLVVVPHWNNRDGGESLDTSRCYLGDERFQELVQMLPEAVTILGLDENTAILMDPAAGEADVIGKGGIEIRREGEQRHFQAGDRFSLQMLGEWRLPDPRQGRIPAEIWRRSGETNREDPIVEPSAAVQRLVEEREAARNEQNWARADQIRDAVADLGWQIQDTSDGPVVEPIA